MAEARRPAGSGHSSVCLKHSAKWNNRFYWVLNRLKESVIKNEYQKRVGALVCTCDVRENIPVRNDPFRSVTSNDMYSAVQYMRTFLITNNRHDNIDTFKQLLEWFTKEGLIPSNSADSQPNSDDIQKSSAHRFLYILQQCLLQNYKFLEPPPPLNQNQDVLPEEVHIFRIDDVDHNLVGSIIGVSGTKLRPLLRLYKCHIKVDKTTVNRRSIIEVTVKKKTRSRDTLLKVEKAVRNLAKDVKKDEDEYKKEQEDEEKRHRDDFKKLLLATPMMSRTSTWHSIWKEIINDVNYFTISRAIGPEKVKRLFYEIQEECYPQETEDRSSSSASSGGRTFDGSHPSMIVHNNTFSDEETEDTNLKRSTNTNTATALQSAGSATGPVPSTSGMQSNLNLTASLSRAETSISQPMDLTQPLSTAQEGRLPAQERQSLCLVHDRSWVPTYQFALTQCFEVLHLEKRYGRPFSRFVCCCQGSVPDCLCHFRDTTKMKEDFKSVIAKIQTWSEDVQNILKPLIRELERVQEGEFWKSLYRFVFLFLSVENGRLEYLNESHRLPYEDSNGIFTQVEEEQSNAPSSYDVQMIPSGKTVEKNDECHFHGKKKQAAFQCVVNYLTNSAGLPPKYRTPFCKAVCCCNEGSSPASIFNKIEEQRENCFYMKSRLSLWRGDSKKSIEVYIALLEQFLKNGTELTRGFQKFVYYFKCASKKEYGKFK